MEMSCLVISGFLISHKCDEKETPFSISKILTQDAFDKLTYCNEINNLSLLDTSNKLLIDSQLYIYQLDIYKRILVQDVEKIIKLVYSREIYNVNLHIYKDSENAAIEELLLYLSRYPYNIQMDITQMRAAEFYVPDNFEYKIISKRVNQYFTTTRCLFIKSD